MKVVLRVIDPQCDFTLNEGNKWGLPKGSLFVEGADDDMPRLATFIEDVGDKLDSIEVTLDSHHDVDISHPAWWVDDNGEAPPPITTMSYDEDQDVFVGELAPWEGGGTRNYHTRKLGNVPFGQALVGKEMSYHAYSAWYLKQLVANARYPHVIWPPHCRIGSIGTAVHPDVMESLTNWATKRVRTVNFVTKGSNPFTEHFSAVKAEVPLPFDPGTQINIGLVRSMETADLSFWAGEALSHCLSNSASDTIAEFADPELVKKMVLLSDACSNVTGFESFGDQFIKDMVAKGMKVMTCAEAAKLLK